MSDQETMWDDRRKKAAWALDTTRMAKSGYAPRKATLAEWVMEAADEIGRLSDRIARIEQLVDAKATEFFMDNLGRNFVKVICGPCVGCQKRTEFILDRNDFDRWQAGTKVQDAFPYMTNMERETLISGVCSDECWDELWGEDG